MASFWVKYRGTRFPIRRGETILGRSPYCSIVVSNALVSREHCALRMAGDGLQVVDLNSTNGVTVNGQRVNGSQQLRQGDMLGVGTDVLEVITLEGSGSRTVNQTTRSEHLLAGLAKDDGATLTHGNTLELIEALVASASESDKPTAVSSTIQRSLEDMMSRVHTIDQATTTRVAAVVEKVAGWHDDGTLDGWRQRLLERLAEIGEK